MNTTCKNCIYSSSLIAIGMGFRCTKPENVEADWNTQHHQPALIPKLDFSCDFYEERIKNIERKISNQKEMSDLPKWVDYVEIDFVSKWYHSYGELYQKAKELHIALFPEEYHTYEMSENKIDAFQKEYLEKVNLKRQELEVSLISSDESSFDSSSMNFCIDLTKKTQNYVTYDFIADVHGRYTLLKEKLIKLGYKEENGVFVSKNRRAIFLGDLVDRGDEIGETLKLVKQMCDDGIAQAVLGNHDWNWLMYHTKDKQGNFLRAHSVKNEDQNKQTRIAWENIHFNERTEILHWLGELPFVLDTEMYRVVHAYWNIELVNKLKQCIYPNLLTFNGLKEHLIHVNEQGEKGKKAKKIKNYAGAILSGIEYKLPQGITFKDVDGNIRNAVRLKWWELDKTTDLKKLALQPTLVAAIDANVQINHTFERLIKPTFFGHYHNQEFTFNQVQKLYSLDVQNDIGICSIYNFKDQSTYIFN